MTTAHSFHIPVMGIGFTADTPLKVSQYGIDSVVSLVDDSLLERLRKMYCEKFNISYYEISRTSDDYRAKRITSYLNLLNELAEKKFEEFKSAATRKHNELKEYLNMLPERSELKNEFKALINKHFSAEKIDKWIKTNISRGSIDVNIMTKIDRENYKKGEKLPSEFNDAHAALRGYANSDLSSSIIFSAGMNPSLYSYVEQFEDFYPNAAGQIKKKIILKVSDYRSAFIQGKFLAKKGLWVSEYRVESGLNCGGHAFATDGFLMGPILEEFKNNRHELTSTVNEILKKALADKSRIVPTSDLQIKISAQGGVGTAEEHQFLIEHYGVDSVGWGTPFLLVPEAVNIDEPTLDKLAEASEKDLFLSDISPLGVPFNSLSGNTKDIEKLSHILNGTPGSTCPKQNVALNNEFTQKGICTASRQYQTLKIKELKKQNLPTNEFKYRFNKIVDKSCICVGLGTSARLVNNLDTKVEGEGVSVCPGPNMAYFSKKMKLKEMIDHIYGRTNVITRSDRPNVFVKELQIYIDYIKSKIAEAKQSFASESKPVVVDNTVVADDTVVADNTVVADEAPKSILSEKQQKYFATFIQNLENGIDYYSDMFEKAKENFKEKKETILKELRESKANLASLLQK